MQFTLEGETWARNMEREQLIQAERRFYGVSYEIMLQ